MHKTTGILGAKNPRTMNQNGTEIVVRILKDRSSVALWAEEKLQEEGTFIIMEKRTNPRAARRRAAAAAPRTRRAARPPPAAAGHPPHRPLDRPAPAHAQTKRRSAKFEQDSKT